jgi:hypothetical protein
MFTSEQMLEKPENRATLSHFISRVKRIMSPQVRSAYRYIAVTSDPNRP